MISNISLGDISYICSVMVLFLIIVFAARFIYFVYKYETYLRKNWPERVSDITIFFNWNGIRTLKNILKKVEIDDAKLLKLKCTVRNSFYYLIALGFLSILFFS